MNKQGRSKLFKQVEEWVRTQPKVNLSQREITDEFLRQFDIPNTRSARGWVGPVWDTTYRWTGFIMDEIPDNEFHRILVSRFNGEPFVIRGYPTVKYIKNPNFKKPMIAQPNYDGIRVDFFKLPNGKLHGKNVAMEYIERDSLYNRNYGSLIRQINVLDNLENMLTDHPTYIVMGELFGNHPWIAGAVDYDVEINWLAFDIIDRTTQELLDWDIALSMFKQYGIPHVDELVTGAQIQHAMDTNGGVVYKHYHEGTIEVYKLLSNNIMDIWSERDNLNSRRMQVCMRELLNYTCEFHSYFSEQALIRRMQKYNFSKEFIDENLSYLLDNTYANQFEHTGEFQTLPKVEHFLDTCFFERGYLYRDDNFDDMVRGIMETIEKAVVTKERVDKIFKHYFLNKTHEEIIKLITEHSLDNSMLDTFTNEEQLTEWLNKPAFQELNARIKAENGLS